MSSPSSKTESSPSKKPIVPTAALGTGGSIASPVRACRLGRGCNCRAIPLPSARPQVLHHFLPSGTATSSPSPGWAPTVVPVWRSFRWTLDALRDHHAEAQHDGGDDGDAGVGCLFEFDVVPAAEVNTGHGGRSPRGADRNVPSHHMADRHRSGGQSVAARGAPVLVRDLLGD